MTFGVSMSMLTTHYLTKFLDTSEIQMLVWSAIAGAGFFAAVILQLFLIRRLHTLLGIALIESIAPLVLFIPVITDPASRLLLVSVGVFFLLLAAGLHRGRAVMTNSVRIKFFLIVRPMLPKAFTGFFIFISIVVYLSYFQWSTFNENVARRLSDELVNAANPALQVWVPGISVAGTLDEFLYSVAESQLKQERGSPLELESTFHQLPVPEQAKVIAAAREQLKTVVAQAIGPVQGDESVKDIVFRALKEYTEDIRTRTDLTPFIGVGVVLLVFTTLKSLSFVMRWVIELLGLILYKVLMAVGFARITRIDAKRETIVL